MIQQVLNPQYLRQFKIYDFKLSSRNINRERRKLNYKRNFFSSLKLLKYSKQELLGVYASYLIFFVFLPMFLIFLIFVGLLDDSLRDINVLNDYYMEVVKLDDSELHFSLAKV